MHTYTRTTTLDLIKPKEIYTYKKNPEGGASDFARGPPPHAAQETVVNRDRARKDLNFGGLVQQQLPFNPSETRGAGGTTSKPYTKSHGAELASGTNQGPI